MGKDTVSDMVDSLIKMESASVDPLLRFSIERRSAAAIRARSEWLAARLLRCEKRHLYGEEDDCDSEEPSTQPAIKPELIATVSMGETIQVVEILTRRDLDPTTTEYVTRVALAILNEEKPDTNDVDTLVQLLEIEKKELMRLLAILEQRHLSPTITRLRIKKDALRQYHDYQFDWLKRDNIWVLRAIPSQGTIDLAAELAKLIDRKIELGEYVPTMYLKLIGR